MKAWSFVARGRLLGDIPFGFDAEVGGVRFNLRGPFRHAGVDYYAPYLIHGAYEPHLIPHITQVVR